MVISSFLSYTFLTAYTPGPNNIMSMTNAGRDGMRRTVSFITGIFSGFIIVMTACAVFTSLLYNLIPSIRPIMIFVGAGYILWLAWTIWRDKPAKKKNGISSSNTFMSGMLLQFVNVKIILYGITAMSSYVLPNYNSTLTILFFALLLTLIGTSGCICWAFFGSVFEGVFNRYRKQLNSVMALLLVYCAVTLFK